MKYFVDTNLLVYARDLAEPDKNLIAQRWLKQLWSDRSGYLSFQVLQEYYVTVTQKLRPGLSLADARDDITALQAWRPLSIDEKTIQAAWRIQDKFGFSFWDCLIVAAAQLLSCDFLLSEDLQRQQSIDGLVILNPFLAPIPND